MKSPVKSGLILAVIWIVFKMVLYYLGKSNHGFTIGIFLNILFVLLAAAIGLYYAKHQSGRTHFLQDVKISLRGSIVYTVIISIFVYFYYDRVDPLVMQNKIDEKIAIAEKQVSEDFESMKEDNPSLREVTAEQYVELVREDAETIHTGFVQSTFTLIALMLASILYSFLVPLIFRKIVFRE